jgi:signal peptide peptidase SppA
VVGSADIHRALQECPKPIVTSMGEVAASGGYYIACATDYIIARPGTITGSIGVISQYVNAAELLDKLGIHSQVIKSGTYKDQGSVYRELTDEEVAMMQAMVDEMYQEFVAVVADGRGMDPDQVLALADGRVFTGRQAVSLGLVDAEGNLDDAIAVAARLAGLAQVPDVIYYTTDLPGWRASWATPARSRSPVNWRCSSRWAPWARAPACNISTWRRRTASVHSRTRPRQISRSAPPQWSSYGHCCSSITSIQAATTFASSVTPAACWISSLAASTPSAARYGR